MASNLIIARMLGANSPCSKTVKQFIVISFLGLLILGKNNNNNNNKLCTEVFDRQRPKYLRLSFLQYRAVASEMICDLTSGRIRERGNIVRKQEECYLGLIFRHHKTATHKKKQLRCISGGNVKRSKYFHRQYARPLCSENYKKPNHLRLPYFLCSRE